MVPTAIGETAAVIVTDAIWPTFRLLMTQVTVPELCVQVPVVELAETKDTWSVGSVSVMKAEDLLVERVLVSVYPQPDAHARKCARTLAGVALRGQIGMNWAEIRRVAQLPEYRNLNECETLVNEVANELKLESPFHPD